MKRTPFAKKSLGQNFLSDENYVRRIVAALGPGDDSPVLEIGPGRGALTAELIAAGREVAAIEIDRDLVPLLRDRFGGNSNFRLIEGDALEIDLAGIFDRRAKMVANLPYYISTAILRRLAEKRPAFSELVLMLQREVVDRIVARPGESERGFLTVIVEACFRAERLFDVPPNAFRPAPKVTSAVVRLIPKPKDGTEDDKLFAIAAAGFRQKRKTILNNLKNVSIVRDPADALAAAGIDPRLRAEDLTLDQWKELAKMITV